MKQVSLVIVCHPDDESLWIGGTLHKLRLQGVHFEIICLTNGSNQVRAAEFQKACEKLQIRGTMLDYPDGPPLPDLSEGLNQTLLDLDIDENSIDYCLTHSPHGEERGHPHHKQCFNHVRNWCSQKNIRMGFFSDRPIGPTITNPLKGIFFAIKSLFAKHRYEIQIDLAEKHKLLDVYQSRQDVTSNKYFKTYDHTSEFLYLQPPGDEEGPLIQQLKAG